MRLNPDRFNRFLAKMGQDVTWSRAIDCPCRSAYSGGADPACPSCHGVGQHWDRPTGATIALTGQKVQRAWAQFGQWEQGDVTVSLPSDSPAYAMGEYDRVLFSDSSEPFSESYVRGREQPLRYPIVRLDRAVVRDADGFITPISLPEVIDNAFVWTQGGPAPGQSYSISGRKRPEYYCYQNFPQDRAHHQGRELPRVVVLRRFDLLNRY
jgi:hypothetical protein